MVLKRFEREACCFSNGGVIIELTTYPTVAMVKQVAPNLWVKWSMQTDGARCWKLNALRHVTPATQLVWKRDFALDWKTVRRSLHVQAPHGRHCTFLHLSLALDGCVLRCRPIDLQERSVSLQKGRPHSQLQGKGGLSSVLLRIPRRRIRQV